MYAHKYNLFYAGLTLKVAPFTSPSPPHPSPLPPLPQSSGGKERTKQVDDDYR